MFQQMLKKSIYKSQKCQRNWDLSKDIPKEDVEVILTSATQCPSKQNLPYYKVHAITDRKMIEKITPLGRMGSSEDIANLIEFLCSNKSSYITGNLFYIDGGLSLVGQESIARDILGYNHKK